MGWDKNSKVGDDVDNARGEVITRHVDIAFWSTHILGRALESLDKGSNQVKDGIAPDQTM